MKLVYSLVFADCSNSCSFQNALVGPKLFDSRLEALNAVFTYVAPDVVHGGEDFVDAFIKKCVPGFWKAYSIDELLMKVRSNVTLIERFLDEYFSWRKLEDDYRGFYEISHIPTISFIEALRTADAVEVDGNFIRHFEVTDAWQTTHFSLVSEKPVFSAETTDDEGNELAFQLTKTEADYARYDPQTNSWIVGNYEMSLIKFQK